MKHPRLVVVAAVAVGVVLSGAPARPHAQEAPPPPPPPPAAAAGHGHLLPIVVGAVAGAYLWPLLFPAITEIAVVGEGGTLGRAVGTVAGLPAAAAESIGVAVPEVPSVAVAETVSGWRVNGWYSSAIGAVHGAYVGYLVSH